jgi:transposase-like protein
MTEERLVLAELLEKAGDFLRAVAEALLRLLMETRVEGLIGAGRYERSGERTTWRDGYRDRTLGTRLGSLQLRIPKLRQSLPSRKRGHLLPAVPGSPQELGEGADRGHPGGLDRGRVDPAGRRSGAGDGAVGDQQVAGLQAVQEPAPAKAGEIDGVHAFLGRPLTGEWPYLWLDATYLKQREGGRIVSVAAIIAVAANTDGRREIVGLHIGPSEAETFWSSFLKSLARRGLHGSSW